jgi:hypothetical protein
MKDEKYRIIHMFHVGSILQITSIQINVFKVCLHINLNKRRWQLRQIRWYINKTHRSFKATATSHSFEVGSYWSSEQQDRFRCSTPLFEDCKKQSSLVDHLITVKIVWISDHGLISGPFSNRTQIWRPVFKCFRISVVRFPDVHCISRVQFE